MLDSVQPLVTAIITAAITIVGAATPLIVMWMRSYFTVRENAAMNQVITAAASREAAMLVSGAVDLRAIQIGDPALAALARDLLHHYPKYTDRLGLDLERIQRVILGEAHKLYNTGSVSVAAIATNLAHTARISKE